MSYSVEDFLTLGLGNKYILSNEKKGSLTNFVISYHLGFFFNKETFNVVEDFSFVLFRIEFLGEYVNVEHLKLRLQHEFVVVDADESNGV